MDNFNMKEIIDSELQMIELNSAMKRRIRKHQSQKTVHKIMKSVAAAMVVLFLGGTTVFAGYYLLNQVRVNEEILPDLDEMYYVQTNKVAAAADEYGMINKAFTVYETVEDEMGISLLDSGLSADNPYMMGKIETDNKDFAIISVDNYILGDTSNYEYQTKEGWYSYTHGENYYSPISLTIDIMLSEEQMKNGWETDYLGMYEFVESFKSEQGYQVNLIQSTNGEEELPEGAISEKCSVFVADGIRYTLKGRVSVETMKEIINSMK